MSQPCHVLDHVKNYSNVTSTEWTDGRTDEHTSKQMDGQTDRQANRWTDRKTGESGTNIESSVISAKNEITGKANLCLIAQTSIACTQYTDNYRLHMYV